MTHPAENDAHEVDPQWVPVCSVCWEPVHQNDDETWVHTMTADPHARCPADPHDRPCTGGGHYCCAIRPKVTS